MSTMHRVSTTKLTPLKAKGSPDRLLHSILFFGGESDAVKLAQRWGGSLPDEHVARLETILGEAAASSLLQTRQQQKVLPHSPLAAPRARTFDASLLFDHPRFTTLYCHVAQWWAWTTSGAWSPRAICLVSPHGREFVAFFRRALSFALRWLAHPSATPLERYLAQLAALRCPPKGCAVELIWCGSTAATTLRLVRGPSLGLCEVDQSCFTALFTRLSPHNVVAVLGALLSESKILLVARDRAQVMKCRLALCALIYPLEWCFPALSSTRRDPVATAGFRVPFPCIVSLTENELDCIGEDAKAVGVRHLHDLRAEIEESWMLVHLDHDEVVGARADKGDRAYEMPLLAAARLERQLGACIPSTLRRRRRRRSAGALLRTSDGRATWELKFGGSLESVVPSTLALSFLQPETKWYERSRQRRRAKSLDRRRSSENSSAGTSGDGPSEKGERPNSEQQQQQQQQRKPETRGFVYLSKEMKRNGVSAVAAFKPRNESCYRGAILRPGVARLEEELTRATVADAVRVVAVEGRPVRTVGQCVGLLQGEWTSSTPPYVPPRRRRRRVRSADDDDDDNDNDEEPAVVKRLIVNGDGAEAGPTSMPPKPPTPPQLRARASSDSELVRRSRSSRGPPPTPPPRRQPSRLAPSGAALASKSTVTVRFSAPSGHRSRAGRREQLHALLLLAEAQQQQSKGKGETESEKDAWYIALLKQECAEEGGEPPIPPPRADRAAAERRGDDDDSPAKWIHEARASCLECIATLLFHFRVGSERWSTASSSLDADVDPDADADAEDDDDDDDDASSEDYESTRTAVELFDSAAMVRATTRSFQSFVKSMTQTQSFMHLCEEQHDNCAEIWKHDNCCSKGDSEEAKVAGRIFAAALAFRGTAPLGFAMPPLHSAHREAIDALQCENREPTRVLREPPVLAEAPAPAPAALADDCNPAVTPLKARAAQHAKEEEAEEHILHPEVWTTPRRRIAEQMHRAGLISAPELGRVRERLAKAQAERPSVWSTWSLQPMLVDQCCDEFAAQAQERAKEDTSTAVALAVDVSPSPNVERAVAVKKRLSVMLISVLGVQKWRRRALSTSRSPHSNRHSLRMSLTATTPSPIPMGAGGSICEALREVDEAEDLAISG